MFQCFGVARLRSIGGRTSTCSRQQCKMEGRTRRLQICAAKAGQRRPGLPLRRKAHRSGGRTHRALSLDATNRMCLSLELEPCYLLVESLAASARKLIQQSDTSSVRRSRRQNDIKTRITVWLPFSYRTYQISWAIAAISSALT